MTDSIKKIAKESRIRVVRDEITRLLAPANAAINAAKSIKPAVETTAQTSIFAPTTYSSPTEAHAVQPIPYKKLVTLNPGVITLLTEDKNFYTSVLTGAGIPINPADRT